jgi:pyridoxine 5-phosphate synthase
MTALSINLNKIALIRNSREGNYPDVVEQAKVCIAQGAEGITVHPRPDQRHIRPDDVRRLAALVNPIDSVEFNIEGNPFAPAVGSYPGFIQLVEETLPDQCTLVPDGDDQLTSDHGFDLHSSGEKLRPIIMQLKALGMRVSLFMDPDLEQIELANADFQVQADPEGDWDGLLELYPGAAVSNFDGQPELTEMDALISYLQVLGTMVDFSTFTPDASR